MKALGSCKTLHSSYSLLVSIMRNDTNVEVKYSDDIHSEESKEEEVKQTLISRVVEKNGKTTQVNNIIDRWLLDFSFFNSGRNR